MINQTQIGKSALAIGTFIGLLKPTETQGQYSINRDFFADPSVLMESCGDRMSDLVDLLYLILGAPADNPPQPAVFTNATWLMIQNPDTGGKSPFYLVVPAQDGGLAPKAGAAGIGALLPATVGNLTLEVYIYIPLFGYTANGTRFLLDQSSSALRVGLNVVNNNGKFTSGSSSLVKPNFIETLTKLFKNVLPPSFSAILFGIFGRIHRTIQHIFSRKKGIDIDTSDSVSFSGINIDADIFFSETAPTFQLQFLDLAGTPDPTTYTTLSSLLNKNVETWLGTIVLQDADVTTWLNKKIGESSITAGQLLTAAGFISESNSLYSLTLDSLKGKSPEQIALQFLYGMLDTLAVNGREDPLVKLPGGGIFITSVTATNNSKNYGLGMQMLMPLMNDQGAEPKIDLCFGAWLSGEEVENNWMKRSEPNEAVIPTDGIVVWMINHSASSTTFAPDFTLTSMGLNIKGSSGNPLFSIDGYTLNGAELRASLNPVTLSDTSTWTYGFASKLDQMGIPLAPPQTGDSDTSNGNPVAQSLLQTDGNSNNGADSSGDQASVDPTFSTAVAWYLDGELNLQLYNSDDQPTDKPVIIPVNRQLGPLLCEKIGIGWVNSDLMFSVLFDGSVKLGPLDVSLQGLTVGIPVETPTELDNYTLDLEGMGVAFNAGSISLDGAFAKIPPPDDQTFTEYDGTVALKAGTFALSALGAYAYIPASQGQTNGYTSLFIFGLFIEPLGGPEFFFVTGLAAGFGYNRGITLPNQNSVSDFPFVALLNDPTKYGPLDDPTTLLSKIDSDVPPERGEYWLAAGVRFTSFDLINTSALLSVEFGQELEIGILGISWMSLPPPPAPGSNPPETKFAYAELGIDIRILPSKGQVMASAILTPNSYVIDPDCHLTGGFAFYVWFGDNPHAGQFVMTIGGYNRSFQPPTYFPKVDRLGISWNVSDKVSITGGAYFALTPSAIMAGGGLNIVFSDGNLRAWFKAQMDVLVQWAPFQYSMKASISIGISYKLNLLLTSVTLKVELGASVTIWGPPTGGSAKITWYVISFTVKFGKKPPTSTPTLDWTNADGQGFADTLLPNKESNQAAASSLMVRQMVGDTNTASTAILNITAVGGVTGYFGEHNAIWIVRPSSFAFSALTAFPTTELTLTPIKGKTPKTWSAEYSSVNVRPMNAIVNSSVLNVELQDENHNIYELGSDFNFELSTASVPAAKWGSPIPPNANGMAGSPEMNHLLPGYLMGFQSIAPIPITLSPNGDDALHIDAMTAFTNLTVDNPTNFLPLSDKATPTGKVPQVSDSALSTIAMTLKSSAVTGVRTAVFNALITQFGIDPQTNDDLSKSAFATDPSTFLNGKPLILPTT